MTNRNKAKGTEWETAAADYLNETLGQYKPNWRDGARALRWKDPRDSNNVTRNVQSGAGDIGDLALWPFAGEAKNVATITLPAFIKQANVEARRAGADYGVVLIKARGKSTADGFAVMDIATFARVLAKLRQQ
ncbi:hypothetical protein [Streptomyces sp. NPDC101393]|uniref:hypothetical protein n=1 Tax=Streptomyces sp. NPDC101393 TaxID=3366141 RepID=UPI0038126AF6